MRVSSTPSTSIETGVSGGSRTARAASAAAPSSGTSGPPSAQRTIAPGAAGKVIRGGERGIAAVGREPQQRLRELDLVGVLAHGAHPLDERARGDPATGVGGEREQRRRLGRKRRARTPPRSAGSPSPRPLVAGVPVSHAAATCRTPPA